MGGFLFVPHMQTAIKNFGKRLAVKFFGGTVNKVNTVRKQQLSDVFSEFAKFIISFADAYAPADGSI